MYDLQKKNWVRFTYKDWLAYFNRNDKRRLEIDYSMESDLGEAEKKLIYPSIRAFQKGEHSEGYQFMELAKEFGHTYDEPEYSDAIQMFIREENYHSAYLANYMDHYDMKKAADNTPDKIFRTLRHKGGIFVEVSVLVTAEMIALSYYSALGNVAYKIGSPALLSVCRQMLHDELPHIVFQSYTLSHYSNSLAVRLSRKLLMEGTTLFVYALYGKLLSAGGYDYRRFRRENMGYLHQTFNIIKNLKSNI